MSSISGVTGSLSNWYTQQLQSSNQSATSSSTSATDPTSSTDSTDATSSTTATSTRPHRHHGGKGGGQQFTKALEDQGISGSKLTDLRSQIESAMKDAKSGGSDPKSAIDGVLQAAGVNMDEFKADMGAAGGAQSASDSDSSTSSSANVLSANGLDPSQFQNSLMSMLDSGSDDTSSLFANAPVGSSLDIAA